MSLADCRLAHSARALCSAKLTQWRLQPLDQISHAARKRKASISWMLPTSLLLLQSFPEEREVIERSPGLIN